MVFNDFNWISEKINSFYVRFYSEIRKLTDIKQKTQRHKNLVEIGVFTL